MEHPKKQKVTRRERRAKRVRKKVFGTAERPRLSVFRSLKNIYVQLIDDDKGVSLLGISSQSPQIREQKISDGQIAVSKAVGLLVAEKSKEKGVSKVVFDRGGYIYHGRVKAVAEGLREGGLNL